MPSKVLRTHAATSTVTLTPTAELAALTTYTVTIKGDPPGVKDFNGNAMVSDFSWSFTTGTAPANSAARVARYW